MDLLKEEPKHISPLCRNIFSKPEKTQQNNFIQNHSSELFIIYIKQKKKRNNWSGARVKYLCGCPVEDQRMEANLSVWSLLSPPWEDHRQEASPSFTGACHQQCVHSAVWDSSTIHSLPAWLMCCLQTSRCKEPALLTDRSQRSSSSIWFFFLIYMQCSTWHNHKMILALWLLHACSYWRWFKQHITEPNVFFCGFFWDVGTVKRDGASSSFHFTSISIIFIV